MRISTSTLFERGITSISVQQQKLSRLQEQVSSGRRMLTPADDPVAAGRTLELRQSQAVSSQFGLNRDAARTQLQLVEGALGRYINIMQDVRATVLAANSGTLNDSDRQVYAGQLAAHIDELLTVANATDGGGLYLFAGYQAGAQPFSRTGSGITYTGDQGARTMSVAVSHVISTSLSGSTAFERISTGNGVFATRADAANAGTGVIDQGAVTDRAAITGHTYEIVFSAGGGATTYDILDVTTGVTVVAGQLHVSGSGITLPGMRVEIAGTPADGDRFSVAPAPIQGVFQTLEALTEAVHAPVTSPAEQARFASAIGAAVANIDRVLDHANLLRTGVGTAMRELDGLDDMSESFDLHNSQALSALEDLDYAKALSDVTRLQLGLEAAQKVFIRVAGMSLFDQL